MSLCFKKEVQGDLEGVIKRVEEVLKKQGFGILTRVDFHEKMKEKLGAVVPKTVILGACNPKMAFEAFQRNTDVTGLMPCNAVVREVGLSRFSVELAKPTELMKTLNDPALVELARTADQLLEAGLKEI